MHLGPQDWSVKNLLSQGKLVKAYRKIGGICNAILKDDWRCVICESQGKDCHMFLNMQAPVKKILIYFLLTV